MSGRIGRFLISVWFLGIGFFAFAQTETKVHGVVLDANTQEPLPGANVSVKGTTVGTVTNAKGQFEFMVRQAPPVVVVVSFLGYENQEIGVEGPNGITVLLKEEVNLLNSVVVVGYGVQKRSDLTGALTQITEDQLKQRPVQNIVEGLQGKTSGVDITSNLRPGEVGSIRIRGNRSINASNEPLYVVDGIPLSASQVGAINPNDIASVEILKDASATAIYGSRGANGVILITYKEGKSGQLTVNYDGSYMLSKIHSTTDWMGSGQLLDWQRSAHINGGTYTGKYGTAPDPDFDIQTFGGGEEYGEAGIRTAYAWNEDGTVKLRQATAKEIAGGYAEWVPVYQPDKMFNQNWTSLVSRTGLTQNHQLGLSSGNERSKFYMSAGYLDQEGVLTDQDYERYSLNLKGEVKPKKWLSIGMSLNGVSSVQNYGTSENSSNTGAKDSYGQALALMPYARAYDDGGNILNTNKEGLSAHNVLLNIKNSQNEHKLLSVLGNAFAEVRFAPWLRYNLKIGSQFSNSEYGSFYGSDYTNPFSAVGTAPLVGYNSHAKSYFWTVDNLVYVDKRFNNHQVGLTLLYSAQESKSNSINIRSQSLTFPTAKWYNLAANDEGVPMSYGTGYSRSSMLSYMGRLNYAFRSKYLLTTSVRWDGASVLADGHKWEAFPSAAVAWKLEEESFLADVDWIRQLKLRLGWGVTGNSSVSAYSTGGSIIGAAYVFNETQYTGYKSATMPNDKLSWEKTSQYNIGLDFSVIRGRISGTIDAYKSRTDDLLMTQSIPPVLGYSSVLTNVGATENRGIEVSVSTVNIKTRDFEWRTDFNWSTNKEKIIELASGKVDDSANGWYIGQPISVMRDYKYERLWQNTESDLRLIELYKKIGGITAIPGQVKIKDQELVQVDGSVAGAKSVTLDSGETVTYLDNGFGTINDDDKEILGSSRPDWIAGIVNTFNYKNFELSFFVNARIGALYYGALQTYGRRVENDVWSPANTGGEFPQPTTASFTNYNYTRNYTNGSLVAVRNISLAYEVPDDVLKKIGIGRLQVYAQVLNPWIFGGEAVKLGLNTDDITGWDTTSGAQSGGQTANTILVRSTVFGVRLTL
ncbi:MAG: SusC/RagA family TonB-linked outer membrane protein [Breznakibacter sp.]